MSQVKKGKKNRKITAKDNKKSTSKMAGKQSGVESAVMKEVWGFITIALGIFFFVAVAFDTGGVLGEKISEILKGCFGHMGIIFPFVMIISGFFLMFKPSHHIARKRIIFFVLLFTFASLINTGRFIEPLNDKYAIIDYYDVSIKLESGGLLPMTFGGFLVSFIGKVGLYIFSVSGIIISFLLTKNKPLASNVEKMNEVLSQKRTVLETKRQLKEAEKAAERQKALEEALEKEQELKLEAIKNEKRRQDAIEAAKAQLSSGEKIDLDYDFISGKNGRKPSSSRKLKYSSDEDIFGIDKHESINDLDVINPQAVEDYSNLEKDNEKPDEISSNIITNAYGENNTDIKNDTFTEDNDSDKQKPPILSNKEAREAILSDKELNKTNSYIRYRKPGIQLLKKPEPVKNKVDNRRLQLMAKTLEDTLASFNVDAKVVMVTQGPSITRYEIQPNVGVKVSKIVSLADDIALNLRAKSIRIEAPIPGKAAVGIEVENESIHMVRVSELIGSNEFKNAESKITFGVGKDISGKPIVANLKSMPHLLIAGSTGSGKSVCINSLIASVLYKAKPDEVKMILIDPKVVELGNYNGIPHLLIPVVTDPAKAAAALNWAVVEMNERYNKFANTSVRDLESYNEAMVRQGLPEEKLPQILIIIDELADLMMAAPSQVEESICRLAQKARAAGMHMVVATQRPSVDVITGLIKANIPSRIAFAVSSQFDSRTILDMAGAEKLVGKGDMLFNPLGMGKPMRVQGCFISDDEVNNIIEYVKSQVEEVEYSGEVIRTIESSNVSSGKSKDDDEDELMEDAIECVVNAGQASVSMLQRRFRIGYNRAARIVDMMEARGIVSPQDGSKPRQVLITENELNQMEIDDESLNKGDI